jgi:hypothetical protein
LLADAFQGVGSGGANERRLIGIRGNFTEAGEERTVTSGGAPPAMQLAAEMTALRFIMSSVARLIADVWQSWRRSSGVQFSTRRRSKDVRRAV